MRFLTFYRLFLMIILSSILNLSCNNTLPDGDVITLNYENDETPTYYEAIEMYKELDKTFKEARLLEYGITDAGKPLHLFVISKDRDFNPESIRKKGKSIVLINNGIHPGEPCGIDASLQYANDILLNKNELRMDLENTVICIIPIYSVGGSLNRSAYHRSGQIGPKESGFRGNAKNLDLNRDFAKMDTKNAKAFAQIFTEWKPEIFLDTHTTNGSEHKYAITLISPQHSSIHPVLGEFLKEKMLPDLYQSMKEGPYEMIPYVTWYGEPGGGYSSYIPTPRYSTGYGRMFNAIGFMTENHVYKSYPDRVKSVYHFIISLVKFTNNNSTEIISLKAKADQERKSQKEFILDYKLDSSQFDMIEFQGYEAGLYKSPLTGVYRFGYDLTKPYVKQIPYYDYFTPTVKIEKPKYYIVPQAWEQVIERLLLSGVEMKQLSEDVSLSVEAYYFTRVDDARRKNNWHIYHNEVETRSEIQTINYYEGDYIIETNQACNQFIVEMLEPIAVDSYFRWNFFDPCLETREYFSSYGFEQNAINYLEAHPEFKEQFEQKRANDPDFAANHRAQLAYIYHNTEWDEISYLRYPVTRINEQIDLPLK